jgi:hypothetical protein
MRFVFPFHYQYIHLWIYVVTKVTVDAFDGVDEGVRHIDTAMGQCWPLAITNVEL